MHRDYLRQTALSRVSGNQTEFLPSRASDLARVGEVVINPYRNRCVTEFVLQLQVQTGVFGGKGGMKRNQHSGEQEQSQECPSLNRYTGSIVADAPVGQRCSFPNLCHVLRTHADALFSP